MVAVAPRRAFRLLGVILCLVLPLGDLTTPAWGQDEIPFRQFTAQDGLPHESITALAQTPDGRLWIGTQTSLAVYDGTHFATVEMPDSLRGVGIANVVGMPNGTVWASLRGWAGLIHVRDQRVDRVITLAENTAFTGLFARSDTLIALTKKAVWRRSPERPQFEKQPLPYPIEPVALLEDHPNSGTGIRGSELDPNGTLWILDGHFGPGRLRSDGSIDFVLEPASPPQVWTSLEVTADGRILATRLGQHRLVSYNPNTGARRTVLDDLTGANYVLKAEDVAYVTASDGLHRVDLRTNDTLPPLGPPLGLPPYDATSVLADRAGTLWIGSRSGLFQLHALPFRHVNAIRGTDVAYAGRFMTTETGALWTHTYGSGLVQLRPRRRQVNPNGSRKWGQGVQSADGHAHAIASSGWYRRTPGPSGSWTRVAPTAGAVRGYVDTAGIGYFWHDDGLYRHDPSGATSPTRLIGWPPDERGFHQVTHSNGRLLVRARGHLLEVGARDEPPVQIDTLARFPKYKSSAGRYMAASGRGDVWIVAASGRHRGLIHVNTADPPADAHLHLDGEPIYSVTVSGDSLILASARSGVFLLDAQDGSRHRHLTRNDGLLSTNARGAALFGDSLYVSHETGISVLPRRAALHDPSAPAASITGLSVNHDPRPVRDTLSLAASERTLDVRYAAPYLRNPERIVFEYRLLPDDPTWHTTRRPTRQFAMLDAGWHRFEVRARLGPSVGRSAQIAVFVAPLFYETWWFWGLCAVGLLGLAGVGYRWRVQHLHRRQKRLERAVEDRTQKLRTEKKKTEDQAERLAQLDEAKNRFFANLSHEFRTPLTLIMGPLRSLLGESTVSEELRQRYARMLRNAERLERLIDQLLDLSKLTAGQMKLQRRPVDVVAFVREAYEAFVPMAEREDVALHVKTERDSLRAALDPEKLDTIVSNLLSNAIKYTEPGGDVWITVGHTTDPEPSARIVVKDTGTGIAEDDLRRIFDRFERSSAVSSTSSPDGLGIGLALTRDLAELHGGTVGVVSEPGMGSTFTVRLPIGPVADLAPERTSGDGERKQEPPLPAERDGSSPRRPDHESPHEDAPTLLIVDDDPDICSFLTRELADTYDITTAQNGREALSQLKSSAPDVVVSDVMMPEMDGFELCEAIKEDESLRSIPVLLLTARAEVEDTVEGLESGADGYLTKPFEVRELRQRVGRLLEVRDTLKAEYEQIVRVEDADLQVGAEDAGFVESVLAAIHRSIDDPNFGVDELAQAVALSRRQLSRRLRDVVDESPAALIRRIRLQRAADQIEEGENVRLADVAYAVGFRSSSHFSTAFKKHFGCPPSRYPEEA